MAETCCGKPMRVTGDSKEHGYRWRHYCCDKCQRLGVEKLGPIYSEEDLDAMLVTGNYPWARSSRA